MSLAQINIQTKGEAFYDITDQVKEKVSELVSENKDGLIFIFLPHTSCALTINEAFDPTAREDLERFLKHLAPRNLKFIKHSAEGPDDSPSHMKAMLLQQNIVLPIVNGKVSMGTWQGIYIAEFRDDPHDRRVQIKWMPDKV